jgi:hypothetical protein
MYIAGMLTLFAPLLFAGNAIIVSVHLCARAILQEESGLSTRGHL